MKRKYMTIGFFAYCVLFFSINITVGQPFDKPISFTKALKPVEQVPIINIPGFNLKEALQEDSLRRAKGIDVLRYAKPLGVDINIKEKAMVESLPDGGKVYRLGIQSKGAHSLNFFFDENFRIDKDSRVFAYGFDKKQVKGPFSHNDTEKNRKFHIRPVKGDVVIFEIYEPENSGLNNHFVISQVNHDYLGISTNLEEAGLGFYGLSGDCNVDINCPEGDNWQIEKNSVCMVVTPVGIGSGALINNTAHDGTPYVLTTDHLFRDADHPNIESNVENSWYEFKYESDTCDGGDDTSTAQRVHGASLVATWDRDSSGTDFCLVQLDSRPPNSFYPYYSGWYRVDNAPDSAVSIHHPQGDVKKISLSDSIEDCDKFPDLFWTVNWHTGIMEGGSSGAPFYNQDHRIVGQHYGTVSGIGSECSNYAFGSEYTDRDSEGKISASWNGDGNDSTSLKNHLAPSDTSITELPGLRYYLNDTIDSTFPVDGDIVKFKNIDIESGSDITLNFKNSFETDGTFTLPAGATIEITPDQ